MSEEKTTESRNNKHELIIFPGSAYKDLYSLSEIEATNLSRGNKEKSHVVFLARVQHIRGGFRGRGGGGGGRFPPSGIRPPAYAKGPRFEQF